MDCGLCVARLVVLRRGVLRRGAVALCALAVVCLLPAACDVACALEVVSHDISASLDPESAWISVVDTVSLILGDGDRGGRIRFALNENLSVLSLDSMGNGLSWARDETLGAWVIWDEPESALVAACEVARVIAIDFGADPPDTVELAIAYEGVIYDSLYPPAGGSGHSMQSTSGLIDTAGTYLSWSTFWVPTFGDDVFRFELAVDLPRGWSAVSQGGLVSATEEGDRSLSHWSNPHPMEEVYLVAGPYHVIQEEVGPVALMTFTYEEDPELTGKYIDATRRYISMYSELIGPYPYPKFALVENFWQTGYGMPSFTLLGSKVIRLPFIVHTSYGHEILHNWWGNSVYVDVDEGNWCEGLTTYGADYRYKEMESESAAREYRHGVLSDYVNYVGEGHDFPLTAFRSRDSAWTQAVGYGKSTMVFHMLKVMLGEELFWEALGRFYSEWRFKSATWSDVVASFEDVSSVNLGWYIDQWITEPGAPFIELAEVSVAEQDDGYGVTAVIRQDAPPFRISVPVRVETAEGDSTWLVTIDDTLTTVEVSTTSRPLSFAVDPGFDVMRRLHLDELPITQARAFGADSVAIVVGSSESDSVAAGYRTAAGALARYTGGAVTDAAAIPDRDDQPWGSACVLGRTAWDRLFIDGLGQEVTVTESGWVVGGREVSPEGHTLAVAVKSPSDPSGAWIWVLSGDPTSLAMVAMKLPRYSSYGYLLFEGTDVLVKGRWELTDSPLTVALDER